MIFVGIDVSKEKNDCYLFDSNGQVLEEDLTISNSKEGFEVLKERLLSWSENDLSKVKVGLESTGHYSESLVSYLSKLNVYIIEMNPLSVYKFRDSTSLRKTKTDKNDARYIANKLVLDDSVPYQEPLYHIKALKSLTRARFRLTKELQPLKNLYRKSIHVLFPEITKLFSDLYSNTILSLLKAYPSAKDIAKCHITKLTNLLNRESRGSIGKEKAVRIKEAAKNSIGVYDIGSAIELKQIIARIQFMGEQREELDVEIESIMKEIDSPITTIPGIGNITGATILSEIGDISNFETSAKVLAFAGAEPSCYQSGQYNATNTPMVKHGSKYLRNALYLSTMAAYMKGGQMTEYIKGKKAQGKHFYIAVSHGMKKLVRIIFAVLKTNTPYVEPIR